MVNPQQFQTDVSMAALPEARLVWAEPGAMLAEWERSESKQAHERLVAEWVGKVQLVADLGCGPGRYASVLRYSEYYGFDGSAAMLSYATEHSLPNAVFSLADVFNFSSDRHYDVVLLMDVAQHQASPVNAIRRIMELWDADRYIVTLLVGNELERLLNSVVVPFTDLFALVCGRKLGRMVIEHQAGAGNFGWLLMEIMR